MTKNIPEKLLKIVEDIDAIGNVSLTRLTVLKKWFERPERLIAFAIWLAKRAVSPKGKTTGEAAPFFREARRLLTGVDKVKPILDRQAAEALHDRLLDFQNEYQNQPWARVRVVHHWNLMLVEKGLAIYLWYQDSPAHGYKLAADYCQNFDSRYGNGLNGSSRTKILEMVRFLRAVEKLEGFTK
jgi:hypothetical protein